MKWCRYQNGDTASYGIIEGENRKFGECDVEIKGRKVEPKEEIRGEIARTFISAKLRCNSSVISSAHSLLSLQA